MFDSFRFVHVGYCTVPYNFLVSGGGFERVVMPFLFGIGLHPEHGPILLDAPFDERGPRNMGALASAFVRLLGLNFEPDWSVAARLDELGFTTDDVDHVLVTHLHGDHTGAMKSVGEATFHLSADEWRSGNDVSFVDRTAGKYVPDDYAGLEANIECYEDLPDLGANEGFDVLGDGSVEMFLLPGHTPGHCVYRLHVSGAEPIVYAGDAAHTLRRARGECEPGILPRQFASDLHLAEESLETLRRHLEAHPDDELLLCHDPELGKRVIEEGPLEFGL